MTKFTKGKWKYMNDGTIRACQPNSALLINIILLAGFKDFKEVLGEKTAYEMIDANGRLAAAAPEMYELLIKILDDTQNGQFADEYAIIDILNRIDGENREPTMFF